MALTLSIPNFKENNIVEKATVRQDAASGQPIFIIDNANNINVHDYLLIGRIGGSMSRIYQVSIVSDKTITLTENLEDYTERGTEVTHLYGNKIKIYTAPYTPNATPQLGDFTALTDGIIDIDPDQQSTLFSDPDGDENTWYRFVYYNSYTTGQTSLADSNPVRSSRDNEYVSIDAIRHDAGFDGNDNVTDEDLAFHRAAAQAEINGALAGKYQVPFSYPFDLQIVNIACTLAAGYAMISEYGTFDGMDKTKGEKKRDDARAQLKLLRNGDAILINATGADIETPNTTGFVSGFNDNSVRLFSKDSLDIYSSERF